MEDITPDLIEVIAELHDVTSKLTDVVQALLMEVRYIREHKHKEV